MPIDNVDYSIVIPVYYNEGCLEPLMHSLMSAVFQANASYTGEVIFVDDGSGDGSLAKLRQIQDHFPTIVTIIKLTRNFGQASALLAGYNHAQGKCVITMSADGQEPPEMINDMLKAFFEENYEVVICTRSGRDESSYRIITSRFFYYLMRKLTFSDMPKGGFDFWLLSRRASGGLIRNADAHPFLQAQVLWMGFRTKILSYRRRERLAGVSRLSFAKKYAALLAGILAYSVAPIRAMSMAGCIFALLGFVYAACIVIDHLLGGNAVKGWAPLMIMVLVMGGFQMVMLGVIGEYLWRTSMQVRRRDMYLIDAIYEAKRANPDLPPAERLL
jgi:dolichol-phosphate mannosyltransferase